MISLLRLIPVLCFTCGSACGSDSWPQFRGPDGSGHSDAAGLPVHWSGSKNIRWKAELPGEGWSSPVVHEGEIWMTTATPDGKSLRALTVDLASGRLVRDAEVFANETVPPKHRRNSYASPTPVIAGDRVYVHFGSMGTACLDRKTGSKIWERRDIKVNHQNGPGGSPLLFQDKLLFTCDGIDKQFEIALDAKTGKTAWQSSRSADAILQKLAPDMRKAYGTPTLFTIDGRPQTLTTASNRLYALDPASGEELWHVTYPRGYSNVPAPASNGRVMVFSTGFDKPQLWAIKVGGAKGDATASHVLWKQTKGAPDQSSPVIVGDRVYVANNAGIISCIDLRDGHVVWQQRVASDFAASPIYADGRIYFLPTNGPAVVIKPGDKYEELARNELGAGCMASPAVAGKALIVRTKEALYRIEE